MCVKTLHSNMYRLMYRLMYFGSSTKRNQGGDVICCGRRSKVMRNALSVFLMVYSICDSQ